MPEQKQLTTCLWFDGCAEEAAALYTRVFGGSLGDEQTEHPEGGKGEAGSAMTASFEIFGQRFVGLNGGPQYELTPAISFQIPCETQEEIDYYWDALIADGGQETQCGWLIDKFGVSWQTVPTMLPQMFSGDPAKAQAVNEVMMSMTRLDIAALQKAYDEA